MNAMWRRISIWTVLGGALVAGLAWSFWPQAVPVEFAAVTRGPLEVDVSEEGRTRVREIYHVSAPVAGRLLRIERHAGDAVSGGKTVVATLLPASPSFLDARGRAQAEAAVKSAEAAERLMAAEVRREEAQLAFAEADLKRYQALAKQEATSKTDLERAQLSRDNYVAQLAMAKAELKAKAYDLQNSKAQLMEPGTVAARAAAVPLIAPVNGRVLRVLHEDEAVVAAGTPLFEIGDPTRLEVVVELISEDAAKVRAGAPATLTDWGGPTPLRATVRLVEPSGFTKVSALGVEEQRVNVLLDFVDPPVKTTQLADGFRVIAHICTWRGSDVLKVPVAATFRSDSGWAVFAIRGGRAVLTPVRLGHSNDDEAELLSGLKAGDQVIVHPSDQIRDGARVQLRR